jgi:hypothetical protein
MFPFLQIRFHNTSRRAEKAAFWDDLAKLVTASVVFTPVNSLLKIAALFSYAVASTPI